MMKQRVPEPIAQRYFSVKEAALYLGLSTKSLYRLVDDRRIPFVAISILSRGPEAKRKRIRFDRQALDAFMAENSVVPPKPLAWSLPPAQPGALGP